MRGLKQLRYQVHAILRRNLIRGCQRQLAPDEQTAAMALPRQLDFDVKELRLSDMSSVKSAWIVRRCCGCGSVPGIDATVALFIVATVADFTRFRTPGKLVAYLGLNLKSTSPVATPPATGGLPRPAPRTPGAHWWKRPGQPPKP
jgi:transposase